MSTPNISVNITPDSPNFGTITPDTSFEAPAFQAQQAGDGVSTNLGGDGSGGPQMPTFQVEGAPTVSLVQDGISRAVVDGAITGANPMQGDRLIKMPKETGLGPLGFSVFDNLDQNQRGQMHAIFEALARHDGETGTDLVQALADNEGNVGALQRLEQQGTGGMSQEVAGHLRGWFSRSESGGPGVIMRSLNFGNMLLGVFTDGGFGAITAAGIEAGFDSAPVSIEAPYNPDTGYAAKPADPMIPGPPTHLDRNDSTNYFEPNTNRQPPPDPHAGTRPKNGDSGSDGGPKS
ncbi:hypothetical protein AB0B28_01710 [Glycomyces sp. NPDC046736]|uniref:hypothetical protein n=1 Tax=Glycomyces sp. NPDC046736 TaxID=3155615 RepID=UPI0033E7EAAA